MYKQADSRGNIVSVLRFPKIIAEILHEQFGKNAFTIARWLKEADPNAFELKGYGAESEIAMLTNLYDALFQGGVEKYNEVAKYTGINQITEASKVEGWLKGEVNNIKDLLNDKITYGLHELGTLLLSGKITDLRPYEKLNLREALLKFGKKNIFKNTAPLKAYEDGWRWIDVGRKSTLVADQMSNCGSASFVCYEDATLLVLFDGKDDPHVIISYSPSANILLYDQGKGGSQIKEEYQEYVIDLIRFLGAEFDVRRSDTSGLKYKYQEYKKTIQSSLLNLNKELFKYAGKAERDILVKINQSAINQAPPSNVDKKEFYERLRERADSGEGVFKKEVLDWIEQQPEDVFPENNRKGYTKWLANMYAATPYHMNEREDLLEVRDWYQGNYQTVNLDNIPSFYSARLHSWDWHAEMEGAQEYYEDPQDESPNEYKDKNPEHTFAKFPDGWRVVYVPAWGEIEEWPGIKGTSYDRVLEGNLLGLCLGQQSHLYQDNKNGYIYSLRDPSNKPHVTMRTKGPKLKEEKGKANSTPAEKYHKYIDEFYEKTGIVSQRNLIKKIVTTTNFDNMDVWDKLIWMRRYFEQNDDIAEEFDIDINSIYSGTELRNLYLKFFPNDIIPFATYLISIEIEPRDVFSLAEEFPALRIKLIKDECLKDSFFAYMWARNIDDKITDETLLATAKNGSKYGEPPTILDNYLHYFISKVEKSIEEKIALVDFFVDFSEEHNATQIMVSLEELKLLDYASRYIKQNNEDE